MELFRKDFLGINILEIVTRVQQITYRYYYIISHIYSMNMITIYKAGTLIYMVQLTVAEKFHLEN